MAMYSRDERATWWYNHNPKLITYEVQAIKTRNNTFRLTWKEDLGEDVSDSEIALSIDMTTEELREFLANNFQGIQTFKFDRTYFKNRAVAKQAVEWINSILLANKLKE